MAFYDGHNGYHGVPMTSPGNTHLRTPRLTHQQSYTTSSTALRSRTPSPYVHQASRSGDRLLQNQSLDDVTVPALGSTAPANPGLRHRVVVTDNPRAATNVSLDNFTPDVRSPEHDDLKFRPTILLARNLLTLSALYIAVAAAIAVLLWRSGSQNQFRLSSENVHVISRYFPSLVGTTTMILFRHTVREFIRMTPYINMADQDGGQGSGKPWKSVGGAFFPWQNVTITPGATSFFSFICLFVATFIVSLKVALLASTLEQDHWVLKVRFYPAVLLVGVYVLMAIYTVLIACILRNKSTGLRWDPISIADFVALFAHCNALPFFKELELRHNTRPKYGMSQRQRFRLGYWKKGLQGSEETEVVYGIGVVYRNSDTEQGDATDALPKRKWWHRRQTSPNSMNQHRKGVCAQGRWPNCEHYPYRRNPGVSRIEIVFFTLITWAALAAAIYALAINFAQHEFTLPNNWSIPSTMPSITIGDHTVTAPPIDPEDPKSTVLVYALVFRSIPTYIAGIYINWIIESIDLNMRFMQPFRNMFQKPGEAADTILLAYITLSPLQVPLTAFEKRHYKVMIYSTINTLSPLFPIFVGGLLTVQGDAQLVRFNFSITAYIGTFVSLVIFAIAIPCAWPFSHRLLPRQFYSMADLMAMCHDARFIAGPNFNLSKKERTPSKSHFEARILLSGERFLFGQYQGRHGDWHLGFDCSDFRDADYGPLQSTPHVEWMTPDPRFDLFSRFKKKAFKAAELASQAAGAAGSAAVKTAGFMPSSSQQHYYPLQTSAHSGPPEEYEMHGALHDEPASATLATGTSIETQGLWIRNIADATQRSRAPLAALERDG